MSFDYRVFDASPETDRSLPDVPVVSLLAPGHAPKLDRPRLPSALSLWPVTRALHQRWYAEHREDYEAYRALLQELLTAESTVVDLGAGRGAEPILDLREMAGRVLGVDVDPEVLHNPWVHEAHVTPDGGMSFLADGTVDVVAARWVAEHVEAPKPLLREVRRVLRPGGSFVVLTPNRNHYVALMARILGRGAQRWFREARGLHAEDTFKTEYKMNTLAELRTLGEEAGYAGLHAWVFETQPSYLAVHPVAFAAGAAYERLVNRSARWRRFRGSILARFIA